MSTSKKCKKSIRMLIEARKDVTKELKKGDYVCNANVRDLIDCWNKVVKYSDLGIKEPVLKDTFAEVCALLEEPICWINYHLETNRKNKLHHTRVLRLYSWMRETAKLDDDIGNLFAKLSYENQHANAWREGT